MRARMRHFAGLALMSHVAGASAQPISPETLQLRQSPEYQLGESYLNYIRIKKCVEDRKGYLAIYISDAELGRARRAVKRIEDKLFPLVGSDRSGTPWTTEKMWAE